MTANMKNITIAFIFLLSICNFISLASESQPREKENWQIILDEKNHLEMIYIEPGSFNMGSPNTELGRNIDEQLHEVILDSGYWIGKYEVTQSQWEKVLDGKTFPEINITLANPSGFLGENRPVENISWFAAKKFCEILTQKEQALGKLNEKYRYDLPTEAQWEYACRAGTQTALNTGKELSHPTSCLEADEAAWYWYNSGSQLADTYGSHNVGLKKPNNWGLYDMHGNVAEWVQDTYSFYRQEAITNPSSSAKNGIGVCRGGSWSDSAWMCRSADRAYYGSYCSMNNVGFRIVLIKIATPQ